MGLLDWLRGKRGGPGNEPANEDGNDKRSIFEETLKIDRDPALLQRPPGSSTAGKPPSESGGAG